MGERLISYARMFLLHPHGVPAELDVPLLVWETTGNQPAEQLLLTTGAGQPQVRPKAGEPLVFPLRKGASTHNAFSMGVTVGRTENNDVHLPDHSVSRFHAYFQLDPKSGTWKLVDAESRNGTAIGATRLAPNLPSAVPDGALLRFGDVEMTFFSPAAFARYVRQKIQPGQR